MQLVSRKNFLLLLAAVLVVAMGLMAMMLYQTPKAPVTYEQQLQQLQTQSQSDQVRDIERDLKESNFNDVDRELQDIETELNQSGY